VAFGFSTAGNLKIFNMLMPIDQVTFDQNPKSFKISKAADQNVSGSSAGAKSGAVPSPKGQAAGHRVTYRMTARQQVDFTALISEDDPPGALNAAAHATAIGGGVKPRCDLLLAWTQPGAGSLLGAGLGMAASMMGLKVNTPMDLPTLTLQWGDPTKGFLIQGHLTKVSITYVRFDPIGNPSRAEVQATFEEAPNSLLSMLTNPTSGGVPGRRQHVLSQGECLQTVAQKTYGRPQTWRKIASANGIDDPLRVRPGRSIFLPPAEEVV
jgi:nucleoid-associated protein YgaU